MKQYRQSTKGNAQEGVDLEGEAPGLIGAGTPDQLSAAPDQLSAAQSTLGNAAVGEQIRAQQSLSQTREAGDNDGNVSSTTSPSTTSPSTTSPSTTSPSTTSPSTTSPDAAAPATIHYSVLPGVVLPSDIATKVGQIADKYFAARQKNITVTSGTRTASSQAAAMYTKLAGGDQLGDYANTTAAAAIKKVYDDGKTANKSQATIVAEMTAKIEEQIAAGTYISKHLQAGAVDIRSTDMGTDDKASFITACAGLSTPLLETTPPHFHLQF